MRRLRGLVRAIAEAPPGSAAPATSSTPALLLAPLLGAASAVYGAGSAARRVLYSVGIWRQVRVPPPVLSVGNVTWGGSGKTPMAEYVARECLAAGVTPAILSRVSRIPYAILSPDTIPRQQGGMGYS